MVIFQCYIHASDVNDIQHLRALLMKQDETVCRLTLELEKSTQERKELQRLIDKERSQQYCENMKQQKMIIELQVQVRVLTAQYERQKEAERQRQEMLFHRYEIACKRLEQEMDIVMHIVRKNSKPLSKKDIDTLRSLSRR